MVDGENSNVLQEKHCRPCESGTPPLSESDVSARLQLLNGWKQERNSICKTYQFKNFHQTIAFVNAVAWISHREGHHPDLSVSFNCCRVSYTTYSIAGLSENDFICATKVDALIAG